MCNSFRPHPVVSVVELSLAADFADVFEVRGVGRRTSGRLEPPAHDGDRVRFSYVASDGQRRETLVELEPSPARVRIDEGRVYVAWDVRLDAGEAIALLITVLPARGGQRYAKPTLEQAAAQLATDHTDWVGAYARISSDNELLDRLIDASLRDLHALMMPVGGGTLPAAGIPWYVAPFGRDSLLSACEALMINPDVARGTLLVLAGLQAAPTRAGAMPSRARSCTSCAPGSSLAPGRFRTPPTAAPLTQRRCS